MTDVRRRTPVGLAVLLVVVGVPWSLVACVPPEEPVRSGRVHATPTVPGYPSPGPTWPPRPPLTLTKDEIGEQYIDLLTETHQATGAITVVAVADVYPDDALVVEVPRLELEHGMVPDVLVLVEGTFGGPSSRRREWNAHLMIIDRVEGEVVRIWGTSERLRSMVPKPREGSPTRTP